MKEIRITLEDLEWEKHNKIKNSRTWKQYLMREEEPTVKEIEKEFELTKKRRK